MIEQTALEVGRRIKCKEISVQEAVDAVAAQIEQSEPTIHAYVSRTEDFSERIREVQAGIASGRYDSPLAGVPVAVKDNICTKGMKTTCSSKILGNLYRLMMLRQ